MQLKAFRLFKMLGFNLIELVVVIAIIGILAAVAIPNYQTHVIKSKIATAVQTLNSYTKKVELHYIDYGNFTSYGANTTDTLIDTLTDDPLIKAIYYYRDGNNLRIYPEFVANTIEIDNVATPRIYLYAQIDTTNELITWICGYDASAGFEIPTKYLPSNCQTEIVPAKF